MSASDLTDSLLSDERGDPAGDRPARSGVKLWLPKARRHSYAIDTVVHRWGIHVIQLN